MIEELHIPDNLEGEERIKTIRKRLTKSKAELMPFLSAVNDKKHENRVDRVWQKVLAEDLGDLYGSLVHIGQILEIEEEYFYIKIQAMGVSYNSRLPFLIATLNDKPHLWQ